MFRDRISPLNARPIANCKFNFANGFTLVELLVALAIIALILASVIPYIVANREAANRISCQNNLATLRGAMAKYRVDYGSYPRTKFDPQISAWTAYSGADEANPFALESTVKSNDVTAALWLLVRVGLVTDTATFICPSTSDRADRMYDAAGKLVPPEKRGNFRSGKNLSYSIASPYNTSPGFEWNDLGTSEFVLIADKNPGVSGGKYDDVTLPSAYDPPEKQLYANSNNHGRAGQCVLYSYGVTNFESSAFRGSGFRRGDPKKGIAYVAGDNIYTSLSATPVPAGTKPPADANGVFGRAFGPAWQNDSYLLPSDDE